MTITSKRERDTERAEAVDSLRRFGVEPGTTIYVSCSHIARSGMSRHLHFYIASEAPTTRDKPTIEDITFFIGNALGYRRAKDDGLVVGGCGMDMGFAVVYALGRLLFPEGGPLELSPRRYQEEKAGATKETNGGYLLKHSWL